MENIEQPEKRFTIPSGQNLHLDGVAFALAALTALSSIAALFLINLEYLLPEMARSQGLTLPYEHKLWLAPISIVYLLASVAWTMSHLTRKEH
ncbi:hypothetical protein [Marinobacter fonticola]|uniref:hypothetical protein n=1 Tax=Marinobacter fonticola TaxID=2603215 RepID=UPI0011E831DB|nr:hypothetical protein [Marinobacter fonticola]